MPQSAVAACEPFPAAEVYLEAGFLEVGFDLEFGCFEVHRPKTGEEENLLLGFVRILVGYLDMVAVFPKYFGSFLMRLMSPPMVAPSYPG